MVKAAKAGAEMSMGIDHENCMREVKPVAAETASSLLSDLN